jgi:DivIVA domain-containing protein
MLPVFVALGVLVVIGVVLFTVGRADPLEPEPPARGITGDDVDLTSPEAVAAVRFPVVLRGYRMDDVDAVLDRLSREMADRDAVIRELRAGTLTSGHAGSELPRRMAAPPRAEQRLDVFGRPMPDDDLPGGDPI